MRHVMLLFLVCVSAISCDLNKEQSFINDLQQDNVKGPARKIITNIYLVNTKKGDKDLSQTIIDDFDRKGFVIRDSIIEISSKQVTLNLFRYKKGRLTEIQSLVNGKLSGITIFEEDEGSLKRVKDYNSTGKLAQYYSNITLNHFGLLVSASSFDATGKVMSYYENNYKGMQLIGGFTKDARGIITYRFNTNLNDAQDPLSFKEVFVAGNSTKSNTFNYSYTKADRLNNWTEQICYVDRKPVKITQRIISYHK
jgi:antitoxin component YwqK of YwqJK toxin-antitoxin module